MNCIGTLLDIKVHYYKAKRKGHRTSAAVGKDPERKSTVKMDQ